MEYWIKETCPACKSDNWLCDGEHDDLTKPDVDGIKCWHCKHEWLFPDPADEDLTIEDAFIEDGMKEPRFS